MPVAGRAVAIDPPAWVAAAVAASRAVINEERAAARELVQGQWEKRQAEELERAQRVHGYRRARLDSRIAAELRWIEDVEHSGSDRSEEHTSELQSLMRISYAVFCLKKKKTQ